MINYLVFWTLWIKCATSFYEAGVSVKSFTTKDSAYIFAGTLESREAEWGHPNPYVKIDSVITFRK